MFQMTKTWCLHCSSKPIKVAIGTFLLLYHSSNSDSIINFYICHFKPRWGAKLYESEKFSPFHGGDLSAKWGLFQGWWRHAASSYADWRVSSHGSSVYGEHPLWGSSGATEKEDFYGKEHWPNPKRQWIFKQKANRTSHHLAQLDNASASILVTSNSLGNCGSGSLLYLFLHLAQVQNIIKPNAHLGA